MQFRLSTLLLTVAISAVLVAGVAIVLPGPRSIWMGYKPQRHRQYQKIQIGQNIQSAIDLLGEPISRETYFSRQLSAFKEDVPTVELAKCVEFLTWNNGGNWFYCVGIDQDDKITIKIDGHS